jgi:hypothetical protein
MGKILPRQEKTESFWASIRAAKAKTISEFFTLFGAQKRTVLIFCHWIKRIDVNSFVGGVGRCRTMESAYCLF